MPDAALQDQIRQFHDLEEQKRDLDGKLKAVKERQDRLKAHLIEAFADNGIQSINVEGYTFYLHRQIWASASGPQAMAALKEVGLDDLVKETCHAGTLSAWVREQPVDDQNMPVLPPELQEQVRVSERFDIRSRKSG